MTGSSGRPLAQALAITPARHLAKNTPLGSTRTLAESTSSSRPLTQSHRECRTSVGQVFGYSFSFAASLDRKASASSALKPVRRLLPSQTAERESGALPERRRRERRPDLDRENAPRSAVAPATCSCNHLLLWPVAVPRFSLTSYGTSTIAGTNSRSLVFQVPGSHTLTKPQWEAMLPVDGKGQPAGAIPVLAKSGSTLLFDRRLRHSATANWDTETTRKGSLSTRVARLPPQPFPVAAC